MAKFITFTFFLLSLWVGTVYAQDSIGEGQEGMYYYDKEAGEFLKVPETQEGVDSLLTISWESRNTDLHKGLQAARLGLNLSESLSYRQGTAHAHMLMGVSYMRLGAHDEALQHYLTGLDMYNQMENKERAARVLTNIGTLYTHQKNYEQATEYFKRAVKQLEEIGNEASRVIAIVNIGVNYYYQGKYKESLKYYKQALELLNGPVDNELVRMITITNLGNSYVEMGEYEKAERHLLQAIDFFDRRELIRNQSGAYLYVAKLYQRWGNRDQQALDYARRGLEKAKIADNKQYIIEGYERLAGIYEDRNNYRQAYNLYKQFKAVQDSMLSNERATAINEMQTRFDVEQKDREIELLNKEASLKETQLANQKLWHNFLIIGLVLFAVIGGLLYRYNNQKKRANQLLEKKNREIERQNKELVQLNEEKNEFLGMAAHDLRNPLTGITSVAGLLKEEEDISEEEFQEYVDIIQISADRMLNLIKNLLNVNFIEKGGNHLRIVPTDVRKPLERSLENFEKTAEQKHIQLTAEIPSDIKPIQADEDAVQRILENLISNAIKYSPPDSFVKVAVQMKADYLELSVKDHGSGIPEDEQEQLFKRFGRISTQPTGNESSTGLGLFIVKKLTEAMNGNVSCESRPGEGAEFIVQFPVAAETNKLA